MPHAHSDTVDSDIAAFSTRIPPPPYTDASIDPGQYDLTPTLQIHNRPRLPDEKRNPFLRDLPEDATIVKFQTIVREAKEIVVGRIKVPTPGRNPHAFILRRYDTNAVSLTTMFKVAFPSATEDDERREMDWVKSSYDTSNTNGGRGFDAVRLAGQWVSRHLAIHLAPAYGISGLVGALARAVPDPNVTYRKSQRSQAAAEEMARHDDPASGLGPPVPSLTSAPASPASKRLRRQSPHLDGGVIGAEQTGERHVALQATTTVTAPNSTQLNMEAEIQSAKQLVVDLQREMRLRAAAGEVLEDQSVQVSKDGRGTKRVKGEDEGVTISGGVGKDRVIRKSKRVEKSVVGQTTKQLAWGAVLFGLGIGTAAIFPQLVANFF